MSKFVVASVSLFENEISQVIVEADSWQEAAASCGYDWVFEDQADISYHEAQEMAFNGDCLFSVIEIE